MSDARSFSCQAAVEEPGAVAVVALVGELDHEAADPFEQRVDELYRVGHRRFVFDLGRLTYVGSMGLRVFTSLALRIKGDGAICLCDPTPAVQSVLDVLKFSQLLPVYPTRAEALEAVRAR